MATWTPKVAHVDRVRAAHINALQTLKADIVKDVAASLGTLDEGELGFATDTKDVHIGASGGNQLVSDASAWAYLEGQDQAVKTTSSPTFHGHTFAGVVAPSAATAALITAAGNIDAGNHGYCVTFVTADGETNLGVESNIVTCDVSHAQVGLTGIPVSADSRVTQRKIYRSKIASATRWYLLATIADNTTTIYTDNTADANLTGEGTYLGNDTTGQLIYNGIQLGQIYQYISLVLGYRAGLALDGGGAMTAFGYRAGRCNTTGHITVVGDSAGELNTTGRLTAVGDTAGRNSIDKNSEFFGYYAGYNVTEGPATCIGFEAGYSGVGSAGMLAIGYRSLYAGCTAAAVGIGYEAGYNNTTAEGLYIGYKAGRTNTTAKVIAIGREAATAATGADGLIAIGYMAIGSGNCTGPAIAIGYYAGQKNTTAGAVYIGHEAGRNTVAAGAVFIGYHCGYSNTSGWATGIGYDALYANTSGWSVGVGYRAGNKNATGNGIYIGEQAGYGDTSTNAPATDTNGILIGQRANRSVPTATVLTNYVGIGYGVLIDKSNQVKIGNASITEINLHLTALPAAANNAAAAGAGIAVGGLYRTDADPSVVCIRSA